MELTKPMGTWVETLRGQFLQKKLEGLSSACQAFELGNRVWILSALARGGTLPPRPSCTVRPKIQQTAEKRPNLPSLATVRLLAIDLQNHSQPTTFTCTLAIRL